MVYGDLDPGSSTVEVKKVVYFGLESQQELNEIDACSYWDIVRVLGFDAKLIHACFCSYLASTSSGLFTNCE